MRRLWALEFVQCVKGHKGLRNVMLPGKTLETSFIERINFGVTIGVGLPPPRQWESGGV